MSPKVERWVLAGIVLTAAALRLSMLDKPIDYDEAYTYLFYASTPFRNAVSAFGPGANNHLFHTLCAWLSTRAFGASALTLRLPVLVAGIALPVLTYRLSRLAVGRDTGLLAAALVGGSHYLVDYSVNARGYGLQAALFVAALIGVWRLVERPSVTRALFLGLLLALALFTVPTLILGAGSVFLWGGWRAVRHRTARGRRLLQLGLGALTAGVLTALFYAPALPAMLKLKFRFTGSPPYGDLASFSGKLLKYFHEGLPSVVALLVLGAIPIGVVCELVPRHRGLARRKVPLAVLWLTCPVVGVLLHHRVSDSAPFPRNFIFLLPLLFILAGQTLSSIVALVFPAHWAGRASALLALALFAATAVHSVAQYRAVVEGPYANARRVFDAAVIPLQRGDCLLVDGNMWERLRFYAVTEGVDVAALGRRGWDLTVVGRRSPDRHARRSGRVFVLEAKARSRKPTRVWLERRFGGDHFTLEARWQPGDRSVGGVTLFEARHQRQSTPQ